MFIYTLDLPPCKSLLQKQTESSRNQFGVFWLVTNIQRKTTMAHFFLKHPCHGLSCSSGMLSILLLFRRKKNMYKQTAQPINRSDFLWKNSGVLWCQWVKFRSASTFLLKSSALGDSPPALQKCVPAIQIRAPRGYFSGENKIYCSFNSPKNIWERTEFYFVLVTINRISY